ncbi:MAG: type II toxin-antitoxin system VapC family toxin [Candidatus Limnocylindrales bacterium]|nr:type II toxin-antitoxin system VapC family toxin [Candidatus Limnocylindrales bacterium]
MRVLLDTHAFLWWTSEDGRRLSDRARALLIDPSTDALVSVASAWEIAIKAATGRLEIDGEPEAWVPERITRYGFSPLPVELAHALRAGRLPLIHRDPFDRLLVAQAQVEGIPIVTSDPSIARYAVEVIW